ncbi:exopolysaccharide transport family protein [Rhizomicrobium palustre]|uniref:non-specific protein-tyrosine kinase n=1 Tax=Rhizomicrobium palustre TaxID=189966 RepID=A0A846N3Q3_9PROT|nr:polysaccharide biosynthesis tyrosine autokinase [Rhizomicrobium palustre]NIK89842.1 exopolysaccharide transport family protein [Rhizomicrobium palustre]
MNALVERRNGFSHDHEHGQNITMDAGRIGAAFRRHFRLFLLTAGIVLVIAACLVFTQVPKYTSSATVLIDQHKQQVMKSEDFVSGLPDNSNIVDTETQIIQSPAIAASVFDRLHLEKDPEFSPAPKVSLWRQILGSIIPSLKPKSVVDPEKARLQAIANLQNGLNVQRVAETFVITISYTSPDPKKAARIANAFADAYLADQATAKIEAVKQTTGWLNARLESLQEQATEASKKLQEYKAQHNLLDVTTDTTLTQQEVSALDQQLQLARADEAAETARLDTARAQLRRGSDGGDVGEALGSPVIQGLRAQRAGVSQRVADMSGRYGSRHPDLLRAKRELADIDGQINAEVQRIISSLSARVQVAHNRVASLEASINRTKDALVKSNLQNAQAGVMQLNAQAAASIYQAFSQRLKEGVALQGMTPSDARVISAAALPIGPSLPRTGLDMALAVVIAVLFGAVAVAIAEMLDKGFSSEDEVERGLGFPSLGVVPSLGSVLDKSEVLRSPTDHVVEQPWSPFTESFRAIRTMLVHGRQGNEVKIIAVSSALPGEGKTTTAMCLARVSAAAGASTVVVDCDLANRGLSGLLQAPAQKGLIDVLDGSASLSEVLIQDDRSGAYILPVGARPQTPRDVFTSPAMRGLLEELRKRFDFVILDTSPILAVADSCVIARQADAVLMVAQWRKTPRKLAEASVRALAMTDASLAGTVLSQADIKELPHFGYGRYYGYARGAA